MKDVENYPDFDCQVAGSILGSLIVAWIAPGLYVGGLPSNPEIAKWAPDLTPPTNWLTLPGTTLGILNFAEIWHFQVKPNSRMITVVNNLSVAVL